MADEAVARQEATSAVEEWAKSLLEQSLQDGKLEQVLATACHAEPTLQDSKQCFRSALEQAVETGNLAQMLAAHASDEEAAKQNSVKQFFKKTLEDGLENGTLAQWWQRSPDQNSVTASAEGSRRKAQSVLEQAVESGRLGQVIGARLTTKESSDSVCLKDAKKAVRKCLQESLESGALGSKLSEMLKADEVQEDANPPSAKDAPCGREMDLREAATQKPTTKVDFAVAYDPMTKPMLTPVLPALPRPAERAFRTHADGLVPLADKEAWKEHAWNVELRAGRSMRVSQLKVEQARDAAVAEVWRAKRECDTKHRSVQQQIQLEREKMAAQIRRMEEELQAARREADAKVAQAHALVERNAAEAELRVQAVRSECEKALSSALARAQKAESDASERVAAADKRAAEAQAWGKAAEQEADQKAQLEIKRVCDALDAAQREALTRTQEANANAKERVKLSHERSLDERSRHETALLAIESRCFEERSDEAKKSEMTLRRAEDALARSKKLAAGGGAAAARDLAIGNSTARLVPVSKE